MKRQPSIIISWIGWENALVKQDVVKVRRDETPEDTVAWWASKAKVAKVIGWKAWN